MALLGQKKTRSRRTAGLRPTSRTVALLDATLRNRGALPRLLLCAVALLLLLLAVEAWKGAFPYRTGDRPEHGVAARVAFQRVNDDRANQVKADDAADVPFIFLHDPTAIENLPSRLRTSLVAVVDAKSVDELPPETRAAFGLTEPAGGARDMGHDFSTLKAAVAGEGGAVGNRIDDVVQEFERFVEPLKRRGLADPEELRRQSIRSDDRLRIVSLRNRAILETGITPAEVQLSELLKETGRLGSSWSQFSDLSVARKMFENWLRVHAPITLTYDDTATLAARIAARERIDVILQQYADEGVVTGPDRIEDPDALAVLNRVTDLYNRGNLLVDPGAVIDDKTLAVLRAEHTAVEHSVPPEQRAARVVTVLLMLIVLAVLNGFYLVRNEPRLASRIRRLSVYLTAIVLAVTLGRVLSFDPWRAEIVPVLSVVMIFAIAYNQMLAALTALTLSLILTVSTRGDLTQFIVLMSVSATAVIPLSHVPSRSTLIKVGFWAALVYFIVSWGLGVVRSQSFAEAWIHPDLLYAAARGAGWCLVAGYLVAGSLPFVEKAFGVVTDISLLEMSDISHPLLQELVRRAPGTYNHSISVATIAETAADRIGANGLLVRVGAYFHDIGKMLKPQYFVENMAKGAESRHENLAPAISTLIIIGHVKDGVDLARQYNLPQPLIDFIEQHHGTTLVEYFYNAATRQADLQPDHRSDADESLFRYPGPKPQTREAGVLMLADAVESASRTLSDPTPKRIESLVHSITMKRLLDGQFDECALQLTEIHAIEESLVKSLIAIYHGRIKYPEQRSA